MSNPYRNAFYQRQAEWHGKKTIEQIRLSHERRKVYYQWYTQGWLPADKEASLLEIGSGSGQFQFFLKDKGFRNSIGLDLDTSQVELSSQLGLPCQNISAQDYLSDRDKKIDCVFIFDVIEHLTNEEAFELLELVVGSLNVGGSLVLSVPNADSPTGLHTRYSDITHETSFSPTSIHELLFCHGFEAVEFRDPWPAPVDAKRKVHRSLAMSIRKLEAIRYKLLGLDAPHIWSPVLFARAMKRGSGAASNC